jgi:uncharacterized membrane protein YphA (DoxX/SURF4 family)
VSSFQARLGLRLLCAYWMLYSFPFPLSLVPHAEFSYAWWFSAWNQAVMGAAGALGIDVPALPSGSGDTTFNYVELLVRWPLALGLALLWTLLPRRVSEARWRALLELHLRYVLALAMLGYGFAKVFPGQFSAPSLDRLSSTYGESSPMGLLWTLMGLSRPYAIFGGALEVLGGVLLLYPTTAVLGALVSATVLANIVALNFCFDVPVKLYSSHLFGMAVMITLPHSRRLLTAMLGRAAGACARFQLATSARGRWIVRGAHVAVLLSVGWSQWRDIRETLARGEAPPSPIAGLWLVEQRLLDGTAEAAPEPGEERLARAFFSDYGTLMFRMTTGSAERLRFTLGPEPGTLALTPFGTPSGEVHPRLMSFEVEDDMLVLRERVDGAVQETLLRRAPEQKHLLTERGFHWINEFPLNR